MRDGVVMLFLDFPFFYFFFFNSLSFLFSSRFFSLSDKLLISL